MGFLDMVIEFIFGKKDNIPSMEEDEEEKMIKDRMRKERMRQDEEEKMRKEAQIREEREQRTKEWSSIKDQIYSKYQIPVADDARPLTEQLYGKEFDNLSVFFITDERVVRQRYIEEGEKAIGEFAENLEKHAFVGGPITATLLRRLLSLKKAKEEGSVVDTEIDIDGFTPNGRIQYTIRETDLDGQIIPAKRKFSPRCEMTATPLEGFHIGPFVAYDELYYCTKEEMEQMMDVGKEKMKGGMEEKEKMKGGMEKEIKITKIKKRMGEMKEEEEGTVVMGNSLCPHGTKKDFYCNQCNGDIVTKPSKRVIGIYLDVTGSMQGMKIDNAKKAVGKVLKNIPVDNSDDSSRERSLSTDVALTIFSTDLSKNYSDIIPYGTKFTQEVKDMAIERVRTLNAAGGTPLYQAINKFMDDIWSKGSLDSDKMFFPYTYLIIVSDGEENESKLGGLVYKGKRMNDGFFAKLRAYRDAGLITEIIPFAYGDQRSGIQLINDLKDISGKALVNETDPSNITEALTGTIDSILYGSDKLRMMGIPVSGKKTEKSKAMDAEIKGAGMGGM